MVEVAVMMEMVGGHREGEMILRVSVAVILFTNIPPKNKKIFNFFPQKEEFNKIFPKSALSPLT